MYYTLFKSNPSIQLTYLRTISFQIILFRWLFRSVAILLLKIGNSIQAIQQLNLLTLCIKTHKCTPPPPPVPAFKFEILKKKTTKKPLVFLNKNYCTPPSTAVTKTHHILSKLNEQSPSPT